MRCDTGQGSAGGTSAERREAEKTVARGMTPGSAAQEAKSAAYGEVGQG